MAIHKSAQKRIRQTEKRTARKRAHTSKMRTYIRRVLEAISAGDTAAAEAAFKIAQPAIHRSVNKSILHEKTAARKLSRLSKKIKNLKNK